MTSLLQVVPYYAPAWAYGGPPKVMWEEARALARAGHRVVVFTTDAHDGNARADGPPVAVEEGIEIHRFRNLSNWLAFHQYRFSPRGFISAMRSARPDAIHLSEVRHELAIGAFLASRRRDIPLLVSAHGTLPVRSGVKGAARRLYDRAFVRPMLEGAAALLAQTRHEAELYVRCGAPEERVHLLPLGTDDPPPPGSEPMRFGIPDGHRIVLFLGRIHALKGVSRLIEAFAHVAGHRPDTHLVIAGRDDGDLDRCRSVAAGSAAASRIHFPGAIYGADRYRAYRSADLFAITPTHYEETSLASLEAAAVGTPLLVSAEADVPYLDDFGAGWRVEGGGDASIVLGDALDADLEAAGRAAERMIRERHLWTVIGAELERILARAVS